MFILGAAGIQFYLAVHLQSHNYSQNLLFDSFWHLFEIFWQTDQPTDRPMKGDIEAPLTALKNMFWCWLGEGFKKKIVEFSTKRGGGSDRPIFH